MRDDSKPAAAVTVQRLTFTPVAGHPGGRYARPASLPAGQAVTALEVRPGIWKLLASVDRIGDYEIEVGPQDVRFPART